MVKPKQRQHGKRDTQRDERNNGPVSKTTLLWSLAAIILGIACGYANWHHLSFMFESDRHFSHLSDLEREMTFRTEMGLYFSYYKTLTNAPSFAAGLESITRDNVTEHGHEINTLKRFNLYPEVFLGFLYRSYKQIADSQKWNTETCYQTNRGKELPPILSCEGNGNKYYFYVNWAFGFAGALASLLFFYGVLVSDSLLGGLLAVAAFFFNHGEATRAQWTPPLRETFAYPIFVAEMLLISFMIKHNQTGARWIMLIAGFTTNYMISWQFAQFSLSTQVGSLFVTYVLGYMPMHTLATIALGHLLGFMMAFVLLFGNEMLLTSLFLSSVLSVLILYVLERPMSILRFRPIIKIVQVVFFAAGTLGIKFGIQSVLKIADDAHIFDILRAKFTDFSNFDTRLYTCAVEFDFQPLITYEKLTMSALLPAAGLVVLIVVMLVGRDQLVMLFADTTPDTNMNRPAIVYNVIQMGVYGILAYLIMRLKLFWTPHLCVVAAVLANKKLCQEVSGGKVKGWMQQAMCVALLALMAVKGYSNLQEQWSIMGEYSNPDLEHLIEWVNKSTSIEDAFAGTMPTMANLKLSTHRPIAMHPHYEDQELREECSILGSWDLMDAANRGKKPFCERVRDGDDISPFSRVFTNQMYTVLSV